MMLLAIAGALVLLLGLRSWDARRVERAVAARLPLGADGIIAGAAAIDLRDDTRPHGVLLLHGFGDTPQAFHYLAPALAAAGRSVYAPLLPGHGRTLRDLRDARADHWIAGARSALDALRARHARVSVVGLSMGGALAVLLAADWSPDALVLLAPYLEMPPRVRRVARQARLAAALRPYLASASAHSIHDDVERARSLGFGVATPHALAQLALIVDLACAALPRVLAPTLYVQSREDNRLSPIVAERAFAALGAARKRLEWLAGCGHVITVDREHEHVAALVAEWIG